MTFVLVRHGETDSNVRRVVQVPEDSSQRERSGAGRLGGATPGRGAPWPQSPPDHLRSRTGGDDRRCHRPGPRRSTRDPGAAPGAQLRGSSRAGLRRHRSRHHGARLRAAGRRDLGGRSTSGVADAWAALRSELSSSDCVVAVSHGLVCRSLARHHFTLPQGVEPPEHWGNTSVTMVEKRSPFQVSTLNCVRHLDDTNADGGQTSGL